MTHARTLPRYVGAAGLVAGLLVAFPSLAFEKVHISNVTVGGSTPTTINAYVNARYQYSPLDSRRYYKWQVPVAKSTLRAGALSALGRGVMHPGFQAAILAAGFIISNNNEIGVPDPSFPVSDVIRPEHRTGYYWRFAGKSFSSPEAAAYYWLSTEPLSSRNHSWAYVSGSQYRIGICTLRSDGQACTGDMATNALTLTPYTNPPSYDDIDPYFPATEQDLERIDEYIPPQLLEELWADLKPDVTTRPFTITPQTYPEPWYNQLDVSSLPLSQLSTTGTPAPEVVTHVAKQMENLDAQMEGREKPHPSVTVAPGASADEEMLERWDEPVPDFTEVNPEWQVETIDELPSYNIGIGSGQCPPPTVITLPFPLNSTLTLNWQPFCDLAAMIRGAVIAVAMILALYIVLRRG